MPVGVGRIPASGFKTDVVELGLQPLKFLSSYRGPVGCCFTVQSGLPSIRRIINDARFAPWLLYAEPTNQAERTTTGCKFRPRHIAGPQKPFASSLNWASAMASPNTDGRGCGLHLGSTPKVAWVDPIRVLEIKSW